MRDCGTCVALTHPAHEVRRRSPSLQLRSSKLGLGHHCCCRTACTAVHPGSALDLRRLPSELVLRAQQASSARCSPNRFSPVRRLSPCRGGACVSCAEQRVREHTTTLRCSFRGSGLGGAARTKMARYHLDIECASLSFPPMLSSDDKPLLGPAAPGTEHTRRHSSAGAVAAATSSPRPGTAARARAFANPALRRVVSIEQTKEGMVREVFTRQRRSPQALSPGSAIGADVPMSPRAVPTGRSVTQFGVDGDGDAESTTPLTTSRRPSTPKVRSRVRRR